MPECIADPPPPGCHTVDGVGAGNLDPSLLVTKKNPHFSIEGGVAVTFPTVENGFRFRQRL